MPSLPCALDTSGWGHIAGTHASANVRRCLDARGVDFEKGAAWSHLAENIGHRVNSPAALTELQRLLLDDVGDDVTHGTVHAPPDESVTIDDNAFPLPLSPDAAEDLYHVCKESPVGVRGVAGPQFDAQRRLSREVEAQNSAAAVDNTRVVLPPSYDGTGGSRCSLFGRATEVAEQIRTVLCPEAAAVEIVPFKLVAYTTGDFFGPHVDTPSNDSHFGTLTVHLPTQEDYALSGCDEFSAALGEGRQSELDNVQPAARGRQVDMDEDEATYPSGLQRLGGSLVFYCGRPVGVDPTSENDNDRDVSPAQELPSGAGTGSRTTRPLRAPDQRNRGGGGPEVVPPHCRAVLGSDPNAVDPSAKAFLSSVNQPLMAYADHPATVGSKAALEMRINLGCYPARAFPAPPLRPVQWAAWRADVVHEVTPLRAGIHAPRFRFVVTYKLFKRGRAPLSIPLRSKIDTALRAALDAVEGKMSPALASQITVHQQKHAADLTSDEASENNIDDSNTDDEDVIEADNDSSEPEDDNDDDEENDDEGGEGDDEDDVACATSSGTDGDGGAEESGENDAENSADEDVESSTEDDAEEDDSDDSDGSGDDFEVPEITQKSALQKASVDDLSIKGIAFVLRHMYPPAALKPSALKGLDAVLHEVCANLSPDMGCFLCPVVVSKNDMPYFPFNVDNVSPIRSAFVVRDAVDAALVAALQQGDQDHTPPGVSFTDLTDTNLWQHLPAITNVAWLQLGHGTVLGGGVSYGNTDCQCDWWYHSVALVVSPRIPNPWGAGRRWAALAAHKGSPRWQRCLQESVTLLTVMSFIA